MRPGTTFLSPKWKKNLSKTATAKIYTAEKWEAMHKNKRLSNYIYYLRLYLLYCYFVMQSLFNVYKN